MTADLQARRRIGLTATLVREDGREGDVFSLIGPKRYDAPWKDIEAQGWIAPADCVEVRVTLPDAVRLAYATAEPEERYRLAACTREKVAVTRELVTRHRGQPTLVIGQYLEQLDELSTALDAPLITGETTVRERQRLYEAFRHGEIDLLVVSKVANFSIDLPSAEVAIQVSGSFGSRQEEAQRLGRLLRPGEPGPTASARSPASTRWSPATPSTPTSPRTASGSSPSRATPTGSSTRSTSPGRPVTRTPRRGPRRPRGCRPRGGRVGRSTDRKAAHHHAGLDVERDVVVVRVGPPAPSSGTSSGLLKSDISPASL